MLVSIDWLRAFLPGLSLGPADIAARLTAAGLEVEGETALADALDGVVVAHVDAVEPHPKADKLRLATVNDGTNTQTVVCGAPNVAQGQKVALAKLGTTLPNGMTMEPRKIRGIASAGMLCAEDELGLSEDHEGILVLPERSKVGQPLAEALGLTDVVLELGITPNRPDALSHLGVARDLAALEALTVKVPAVNLSETGTPAAEMASVSIDARDDSQVYMARVLTGVMVKPSPRWVQDKLRAVGQRPISNVVDATNLVLLELGHPLHAFDLDTLEGAEIRVRRAVPKEPLTLLDGSKKKLTPDDLVIADAKRPVALAGVMGGLDTEVTGGTKDRPATTRVLLESAWFDPTVVRRGSKRHGFHTEASHRFERGADVGMVRDALNRCAALIAEWSGASVHPGIIEARGAERTRTAIPIRPERAALLLGRDVTAEEVETTLLRLGLEKSKAASSVEGALWFEAPSWRVDLAIEADLIEEVGRIAGYDDIPPQMPPGSAEPWRTAPERDAEAEVRDLLVGQGFLETISLAFASSAKAEGFADPDGWISIANPLGEESRWMRPSLLPALLDALRHNQDQLPSATDVRLFELGRTFAWGKDPGLPVETNRLGLVFRGRRHPSSWTSGQELVDVYDLKGVLEGVLDGFGLDASQLRYGVDEQEHLHPRSGTKVSCGEVELGAFGEVHPDVAERFGLEGPPVFVAELDVDALSACRGPERQHKVLPKLPPAQRDLSFFVRREVEAADVLSTIRDAAPAELESSRIFDVYEGKGVPEGEKSLAVELVFRAPDRTLSEADVGAGQEAIVKALSAALGARLRDR